MFWSILLCKIRPKPKEDDSESESSESDEEDFENSGLSYEEFLRKKHLVKDY